jgi:hypothetical protein
VQRGDWGDSTEDCPPTYDIDLGYRDQNPAVKYDEETAGEDESFTTYERVFRYLLQRMAKGSAGKALQRSDVNDFIETRDEGGLGRCEFESDDEGVVRNLSGWHSEDEEGKGELEDESKSEEE